ncbi:MAG: TonB-dependent receptor [Ignavibacterium album]|uniref:TonB-dependent receptor family protein n=1 Tax=Ignavibacterium album TaxID=591197 RepID=UPI0026ED421E|nr:TonB-dependent receptor [Ignavibacterium album]MBI5661097.1 TonB-dependent receptor [Ignavibacterium album]
MKKLSFFIWILHCVVFISSILPQDEQNSSNAKTDTLQYQTDEVVVTGTRTNKKIIDIPYSVIRLNNKTYKYDRKTSISDILNTVPGVFMQNRYGNHDVRISIRGFGSRSNSGIRGVRILLDGIPESEPDGQTRIEAIDFNSIGSIEIVKGNSSSLYTNAPGGVVNFINDINFPNNFLVIFNDFGSYELRRNGFKTGVRTNDYSFLATYTYHNYKGYREHSEDYWHILNTVLETNPGRNTNVQFLGYFTSGLIRLPGSLTKEEYDSDPFQAAQREKDFDFKRVSKKGRVALRLTSKFGELLNNEIELTTYGTIKYFERTQRNFRIFNRYGLGSSVRFTNKSIFFENRENEFSIGGDLFYQTGPIEDYNNINGRKGDLLNNLTDETIGNSGLFIQNIFELYRNKLYLLFSGRYDNVYFDQKDQLLAVRNDIRRFEAFTPKAALNYKITTSISAYTSFGFSFDSPAGNELDNYPLSSNNGSTLLNPDLKPQKSKNFELGIKGNLVDFDEKYFGKTFFEVTFFNSIIEDEIVPFEVYGDVYYRNSAQTTRRGIELGGKTEILEGLRLILSYTYSNFRYDKYETVSIDLDQSGNITTETKNFSDNKVPSVPEHNLLSALEYEHQFTYELTVFMKGSFQYVSGLYVNDANEDKTGSYGLLGSTIGLDYRLGEINLLLSAGINNISDKKYVGFVNINSTSGRFYEAGEPRTFFASLHLGYTF